MLKRMNGEEMKVVNINNFKSLQVKERYRVMVKEYFHQGKVFCPLLASPHSTYLRMSGGEGVSGRKNVVSKERAKFCITGNIACLSK